MRKLVVCGAGDSGREIMEMIESMNAGPRWEIAGFSDASAREGQFVQGYPVMSEDDLLKFDEPADAVISVGSPVFREKIYRKLSGNPNISFPAVVHPTSLIAKSVKIPEGLLVSQFCVISTNAVLGKCVFLNSHCAIGHDAKIGDFSAFMSFTLIAGNVDVGAGVFAGAGSVVTQGLNLGGRAELCAGSVVVRDVKEGAKMMGNPARQI
jgi:sugar O-acyltransferase (sialic acid O-acetyltransferase NeuD family)